jgi:hypothetical protein
MEHQKNNQWVSFFKLQKLKYKQWLTYKFPNVPRTNQETWQASSCDQSCTSTFALHPHRLLHRRFHRRPPLQNKVAVFKLHPELVSI